MKNPRRSLIASYVAFGLAVACFIVAIVMDPTIHGIEAFRGAGASQKFETVENPQPSEKPQEAVKNEPTVQPSAVDPVSTPTAPADTTVQGGHVPFTSQPVTPGDPESYVDTVGQCPFYEMAGPKGCTPPPDIECNSDWSECHPKEQP